MDAGQAVALLPQPSPGSLRLTDHFAHTKSQVVVPVYYALMTEEQLTGDRYHQPRWPSQQAAKTFYCRAAFCSATSSDDEQLIHTNRIMQLCPHLRYCNAFCPP